MNKNIWIFLSCIAGIGGLFFIGVCFSYLLSYHSEPANNLRHEYLQGAALALLLAIPFWLAASMVMFPIRLLVPYWMWWGTNTVTVVICSLFIFLSIYP
jgi:hypothetical protein